MTALAGRDRFLAARSRTAIILTQMALTVYLTLTNAALYEKTGYLRYGMILHALLNWSGPILVMTGIMLPPPATAVLFALSVALFAVGIARKDKLLDRLAA